MEELLQLGMELTITYSPDYLLIEISISTSSPLQKPSLRTRKGGYHIGREGNCKLTYLI